MIYYINFIMEIFIGIALLYGTIPANCQNPALVRRKRKRNYCIVCGLLWVLISGLRGLSIGADTYAYFNSFESVKRINWNYLISFFTVNNFISGAYRDPGYNIFVKLMQLFMGDYQMFLVLIAVIFMVPFSIWIYNESELPIISFLMYSTLFYAFFSITGIRQTISTAMVVLVGDKLIKNRRLVFFTILCLTASTIHRSCLIFMPFYFVSRIKVSKKNACIWGVVIATAFVLRRQMKNFIVLISGYTSYISDYEGAGTFTFTIMLLLISILAFIAIVSDSSKGENSRYYNGLFMSMLFTPLTWLNPSAMRIVQYFSLYLLILVPVLVNRLFTDKSARIAKVVICAVLAFLLFRSQPEYAFFWD